MSASASPSPAQIVWFKRDLRLHDHRPLVEAAARGPVAPLYIVEPSLLHAPDADPAHWTFIAASLEELRAGLAALGQPLIVRVGEATAVLEALANQLTIGGLWAHEETGNGLTYARDKAVRRWARRRGIPFTEYPQNGVVRGLKSRAGWANLWEERMRQPLLAPPEALPPINLTPGRIPTHQQLQLGRDRREGAQRGGEAVGVALLNSFLTERAAHYLDGLARPSAAETFSSRLSPHLAYGTLSLRRVVQGTRRRIRQVQHSALSPLEKQAQLAPLKAFESRLHWRCHFMQKLESEPEIEFHNFVRALDGLREPQFNRSHFEAWQKGRTGYPLIDAAMRALAATGWLNFRLRAMLVSFAAYDLWLHWREPSLHLARLFLDYEPGIHYAQMQMQSGTTGINALRIYDPTKQARERDPDGRFIRRWVPELAAVPDLFIHEPWRMPPSLQEAIGCAIGRTYPAPIVDHAVAAPRAFARLEAALQTPAARAQAAAVLDRHGSRRPRPKSRSRAVPAIPAVQLEFDLDDEDE